MFEIGMKVKTRGDIFNLNCELLLHKGTIVTITEKINSIFYVIDEKNNKFMMLHKEEIEKTEN